MTHGSADSSGEEEEERDEETGQLLTHPGRRRRLVHTLSRERSSSTSSGASMSPQETLDHQSEVELPAVFIFAAINKSDLLCTCAGDVFHETEKDYGCGGFSGGHVSKCDANPSVDVILRGWARWRSAGRELSVHQVLDVDGSIGAYVTSCVCFGC